MARYQVELPQSLVSPQVQGCTCSGTCDHAVYAVKAIDRKHIPADDHQLFAACRSNLVVAFDPEALLDDAPPIDGPASAELARLGDEINAAVRSALWTPWARDQKLATLATLVDAAVFELRSVTHAQAALEATRYPVSVDGTCFINTDACNVILDRLARSNQEGLLTLTVAVHTSYRFSDSLYDTLSTPPLSLSPHLSWLDRNVYGWYSLKRKLRPSAVVATSE